MKKILLIAIVLTGCNQSKPKTPEQVKAEQDSFTMAKYGRTRDEQVKHMVDSDLKTALFDTGGLYKAPVKILKAKAVTQEYSTTKNVYLLFKNVSKKTIQGIRFKWYGLNAFGEPAELGNYIVPGFGGGFSDDILRPGKTNDGTWNVYSKDAKKIILAWPYEVSFTDGSLWRLKR